ncbi:ribonucleoside-triphosphate reductase domain protein [Escherichia coli DEC11D]|nr:ribonucleoside-triphosphate reductase domain protein [Escherichia coli DEC11D]
MSCRKFSSTDWISLTYYEDLMNNQKIPDSGVLTQKVKEQIADQLKQAGQ